MSPEKVYVPNELLHDGAGLLVGWVNIGSIAIAASVPNVEAQPLEIILRAYNSSAAQSAQRRWIGPLQIIGRFAPIESLHSNDPNGAKLTVEVFGSHVLLLDCRVQHSHHSDCIAILYARPRGSGFLASRPLSFSSSGDTVLLSNPPRPLDAVLAQVSQSEACAAVLKKALDDRTNGCEGIAELSVSTGSKLADGPQGVIGPLLAVCNATERGLHATIHGHSLACTFHAGHHLALRVRQCKLWLSKTDDVPWDQSRWPEARVKYIKLRNTELGVVADVVLGCCAGAVVFFHAHWLAAYFESQIKSRTILPLYDLLIWLQGAPAGLKLNQPVAVFLSTIFTQYTQWWEGWLRIIGPCLPMAVHVAGLAGLLGLSVLCGALLDFVRGLTAHLMLMRHFASRVYGWAVHGLASTWRHFRGRKLNHLRHRTDHIRLGLDQQVVNCLLFTILLFLTPTVVVYYVAFLLVSGSVSFLLEAIHVAMILANSIPVYALALRLLSPESLPGGVSFEVDQRHHQNEAEWSGLRRGSTTYLILEGHPMSALGIPSEARQLLQALFRHYAPRKVLTAFSNGHVIGGFSYDEHRAVLDYD